MAGGIFRSPVRIGPGGQVYPVGMDWVLIVGWVVSVVVLAAVVYFAVQAAVLSALKAHTRWVDGGKSEPRQRLPYS